MWINKRYYISFLLAFLILLIGRIMISGQGYLNDTDELLYIYIIQRYDSLIHFNIHPWVQAAFDMQGQPPEIIIRLFQTLFVYAFSCTTHLPMTHPYSLYVMGVFNILVSLLILYVFFRILKKLMFTDLLAFTGVILLGTLANMNIYVRHILPYDTALLFQLTALDILLNKNLSNKRVLAAGVLSAIGLTNYFGCFMFVFIQISYILTNHFESAKQFLKKITIFFIPFVFLVLIYEITTRIIVGQSYIKFVVWYSDTITHGSFDEGLTFIFLYFYLVEKWWGICLLCLFFAGIFLAYHYEQNKDVKNLLYIGAAAYLIYGLYVLFFHKMVFFGRVLHIYYPFVIIGVLCCIRNQKLIRVRRLVPFILFVALLNYGFVIQDLNSIGYPRSVIYQQNLFEQKNKIKFSYFEEMFAGLKYQDRQQWYIDPTGQTDLKDGNYTLINFCFFKHFPDDFINSYKEYKAEKGDSLIFEKLHFQSHPIYTFEYCDREGRDFFLSKKFKIKVISKYNKIQ